MYVVLYHEVQIFAIEVRHLTEVVNGLTNLIIVIIFGSH